MFCPGAGACYGRADPLRAGDKRGLLRRIRAGREAWRKKADYQAAAAQYKRALARTAGLRYRGENTASDASTTWGTRTKHGPICESRTALRRSLEIREAKLGPDHPDVADGLNNLALLYVNMGQYAKAEPLYQRSLKIREAKLGPDHPDVAESLNNLANLYEDMGQYAKAEPLFQRSLKIRESKLGPDHPDVATSLNNLADPILHMGQYAKAEPLYQRALRSARPSWDPITPTWPTASTIWRSCTRTWANTRKPSRSTGAASRSARPSWDPITPSGRQPQQPGEPVRDMGQYAQSRATLPAQPQDP